MGEEGSTKPLLIFSQHRIFATEDLCPLDPDVGQESRIPETILRWGAPPVAWDLGLSHIPRENPLNIRQEPELDKAGEHIDVAAEDLIPDDGTRSLEGIGEDELAEGMESDTLGEVDGIAVRIGDHVHLSPHLKQLRVYLFFDEGGFP